jgi:hypothetical protein
MHKYAALTALAIVLSITMLVLAISASLTPANARCPPNTPGPGFLLGHGKLLHLPMLGRCVATPRLNGKPDDPLDHVR